MPTSVLTVAEQAAAAIHQLAVLTRPQITALDVRQLGATTSALAELVAALPQTLRQLQAYLTITDGSADAATAADPAGACLHQAGTIAAHLAAALDAAHQALGGLAETTETTPGGSVFSRR